MIGKRPSGIPSKERGDIDANLGKRSGKKREKRTRMKMIKGWRDPKKSIFSM